MTRVSAIYQGGLLRPTEPIPLEEGAEVKVIIISSSAGQSRRTPAEILADIAALSTGDGDPWGSRDHDRILYGEQTAP